MYYLRKEVAVLNDKKIIAAIAARDEQMLAFVVRKYTRLLWKLAASVLINAASAQDVEECIADVFIYLWQYPERYDPDKAKLSSWLSMVTRSKAVDRYRKLMKSREISIEEIALENTGYEKDMTGDEEKEALLSCIAELSEQEQELLIRRYFYEQKPTEIAAALNLPKKQVENRLYYVKQKLKKIMERGPEK